MPQEHNNTPSPAQQSNAQVGEKRRLRVRSEAGARSLCSHKSLEKYIGKYHEDWGEWAKEIADELRIGLAHQLRYGVAMWNTDVLAKSYSHEFRRRFVKIVNQITVKTRGHFPGKTCIRREFRYSGIKRVKKTTINRFGFRVQTHNRMVYEIGAKHAVWVSVSAEACRAKEEAWADLIDEKGWSHKVDSTGRTPWGRLQLAFLRACEVPTETANTKHPQLAQERLDKLHGKEVSPLLYRRRGRCTTPVSGHPLCQHT